MRAGEPEAAARGFDPLASGSANLFWAKIAGNGGYTIDAAPGPRDGARATEVQVEAPRDVALAADGSIIYADGGASTQLI